MKTRKKFSGLIFLAAILCLLLAEEPAQGAKRKPPPKASLTAKAAIIIDAQSKKILYARNIDLAVPPASTTKLMTALVVLDNLDLEKEVLISKKAANTQASRAGIRAGVRYKAGDLLSACLIASSNDASVALAEAVSGSESAFAELMNKKAEKIGMKNTRFVNASGLPTKDAKQYSTVYDLAQLMRYVLRKSVILKELKTKSKYISGSDGRRLYLKNHNKMLWGKNNSIIGKTGYTIKSRYCFAGAASLGGKKMIVYALLSSRNLWQDLNLLVNSGLYLKKK